MGTPRIVGLAERGPRHGERDLEEFSARLAQLRLELAPPSRRGRFEAYTDGACLRNPNGPGGWGTVVSVVPVPDGAPAEGEWDLWGHLSSTSNNRAEALALLAAMEWVPQGSSLVLYSDSEYAVNVLAGRYRAKANVDVWGEIKRVQAARQLTLDPVWVRGHVGTVGNERADRLAVLGATAGDIERAKSLRQPSGPQRASIPPSAPAGAPPNELVGIEPKGEWETSFLKSVSGQLRAGKSLSEKQRHVLNRMRARGRPESPE